MRIAEVLPLFPAGPQIIKGSYPPMPATRSRELRELCDRMLTLDWNKRPSINEILATPLLKARIQKFLGATLQVPQKHFVGVQWLPQRVCSDSTVRCPWVTPTCLPTVQAHEFSHTIIHGRPKPGQLVVGAGPAPGAPGAAPAAAAPAPGVAAGLGRWTAEFRLERNGTAGPPQYCHMHVAARC